MYLHRNIKYLRLKKKLKQDEFGDIFGLNTGKVSSYENKIIAPLTVLVAISDYFKINIDDLIRTDLSMKEEYDKTIKIEGGNNIVGNEIKIKNQTVFSDNTVTVDLKNEINRLKQEVESLKEQLIEAKGDKEFLKKMLNK